LRQLSKRHPHIRVLPYDHAFNYSAINNYAVEQCSGSIVGFINNDVEVLNTDWLTELVSHALRPEVGAVGALLLYSDHTVQHGGVVVGMHGVADHAFKGLRLNDKRADPFGMLQSVHNPDAVTAAAMVMRRELFQEVGGFDMQHFVVAFNDVDLCLKLRQRGQRIVFTPHARLIHHESKSRNLDQSSASKQRERYEHAVMKARWGTDRVPKANPLLSAYA
jgi:GT2 family glycosyltransferase